MRKTMTITFNILCVIAAVIIIGYITMLIMGIRPAVVISGSMEPTIRTGSLIFVDTTYRSLKEDDIVAFRTGGSLVTHRLVRDTGEGWITKGDANSCEDPWRISENNIIGKTVFWIPDIGFLIGKEAMLWGKNYSCCL